VIDFLWSRVAARGGTAFGVAERLERESRSRTRSAKNELCSAFAKLISKLVFKLEFALREGTPRRVVGDVGAPC